MKNKKLIIFIVLLLLYGLIMVLLFNKPKDNQPNDNNNKKDTQDIIETETKSTKYVIINKSAWMYNNYKWGKTSKGSIKNSKNSFKVYSDNDYLGEYKLEYLNNWNIFDNDHNFINYDKELFAYTNDFDIRLIRTNITKIQDSDKEYITSNYGSKSFDSLLTNNIINIDIDNNGEIDKIVSISNNGPEENDPTYYNLVYVVLNGNLITIVDNKNINSLYELSRIFEINNNKYIIIRETKDFIGENLTEKNHLYKLNSDKFEEIFSD